MVVWAMTRSVGHKLICGVGLNIFKSTHRPLPNKNTRKNFLDDVTRCTFYEGWDLIHSVEVSSENLDLRGEKNCSCPFERYMSARGYFWIIVIADKVFHMGFAINDGELQLVQQKKSVWAAYQCGSRTFFVIKEGKMFSLVRQSWSSLALGSAYPTVHLLPSVSSLHKLHLRVLKREFDIVLLMNLEFVVTGPLEILGKITANAYRLPLPPHVHAADVFNVERLFKFEPGDALLSGFVDESLKGEG
ncbi:unnamed protein product, partial [Brassica oleracea var. botrytis]